MRAACVAVVIAFGCSYAGGEGKTVNQLSPQQIYKQQCDKKQHSVDSIEALLKQAGSLQARAELLSSLADVTINMPQGKNVALRQYEVATKLHDKALMMESCVSLCRIGSEKQDLKQVKYWSERAVALTDDKRDHSALMAQYFLVVTTYWNDDVRGAWNLMQTMKLDAEKNKDAFAKAICSLLEAQIYSFVGNDGKACRQIPLFLPEILKTEDLALVNLACDASMLFCFVEDKISEAKDVEKKWVAKVSLLKKSHREDVDEALWLIGMNRCLQGIYNYNAEQLRDSLESLWKGDYVPSKYSLNQYALVRCSLNLMDRKSENVKSDVDYLLKTKDNFHHQYYYMLANAFEMEGKYDKSASTMRKSVEVLLENFSKNLMREMTQYDQLTKHFDEETEMDKARTHDAKVLHCILATALCVSVAALGVLLLILYRNLKKNRRLKSLNMALETKRSEMEDLNSRLVDAISEETESNRKKNEFIAAISHEIRTPLNAIVGFSEILTNALGNNGNEENREFSDLIRTNSDLMLKLVDDIIDKQANADDDITLEFVDVVKLARQAQTSLSSLAETGVEMRFSSSAEEIKIYTDTMRLQQLLINLIGNAVKFTSSGYICLAITHDESCVTFTVEDTGIGIEPGKEDAIFEKFERVSDNVQGFGLGLYICKSICRRLRGNLYVDKTYHGGARFVFRHPTDLKLVEERKEVVK